METCSFHKTLIDGLELCWLLVDYVMFLSAVWLSFWRHPFTTDEWASDAMLNLSKDVPINKLIYILDGLRVRTFSPNFHFQVNYSLRCL